MKLWSFPKPRYVSSSDWISQNGAETNITTFMRIQTEFKCNFLHWTSDISNENEFLVVCIALVPLPFQKLLHEKKIIDLQFIFFVYLIGPCSYF